MSKLTRRLPKQVTIVLSALLLNAVLLACEPVPKSPQGFSLPAGDAKAGRQVFLDAQCLACHSVAGMDNKGVKKELEESVPLGGKVQQTKTYAELVTSVINPSHRIAHGHDMNVMKGDGSSKMRNYNDVLTGTQLFDLVAFLQTQYKITDIPYHQYESLYR